MKRTLLASAALGALLVGPSVTGPAIHTGFVNPAMAQDSGASSDQDTQTDDAMPAGEEEPAGDNDASSDDAGGGMSDDTGAGEEPAGGGAETDSAPAQEAAPMDDAASEEEAPADDAAADDTSGGEEAVAGEGSGELFMEQQEENEVSANNYIGQSLYNMEDESIGNINDLIFSDDGGVTTAVVGVGGFLGIGQKNVGVNFDMIEIEQQPDSADVRLVIDATREELEGAPEYVTLEQQMAERQAAQPATGGMGTGSATGGMGTGGATTGGATAQ